MSDELPRKCQVDKMCPAELAIMEAIRQVENMGADEKLTDAVCLLADAQDKVAEFIDKE